MADDYSELGFKPDEPSEAYDHSDVGFTPDPEPTSPLAAAGFGAARWGSLGTDKHVAPGLEALYQRLLKGDKTPLSELYDKDKEEYVKAQDKAYEDQPWAYRAGAALGMIPSTMATAGLGEALGAGKLGLAGKAALEGGLQAGILGGADSQAPDTLGKLKDAALGGTVGGVLGGTLGKVGQMLKPEALETSAGKLATKSLKGTAAQYRKLNLPPEELGKTLLDNGLINPLKSPEETLEDLSDFKRGIGSQMGEKLKGARSYLSMPDIAQEIEHEVIPQLEENTVDSASVDRLRSILDELSKKGNVDLNQANQLANSIGDMGYGKETPDVLRKGARQIERRLSGKIDEALGNENSEGLQAYRDLNKKYQTAIQAEQMAKSGASRYAANRGIGLTDTITGSAGYATRGPLGALAGALGNHLARTKGAQTAAVTMHAAAPVVEKLLQAGPAVLGKYYQPLANAASRGPQALAVSHFLLSSQPEYQEAMKKAQEE